MFNLVVFCSGQEEIEEVQQSYSEYYQAGGGDHQQNRGGANHAEAANQAASYEMTDMGGQNTMSRSATGTIPRTDVIVDTLAGGSSQRGGNYHTTTTTTEAHHNDYEEQERNMSFA